MQIITSDKRIYSMDKDHAPNAYCESGDTVCFETLDCYGGQITNKSQKPGASGFSGINPATGPLYVKSAQPGDILKIEIVCIELDDQALMVDAPGMKLLGPFLPDKETRFIPIRDGKLVFNDKISLDVRAMIGVIGTAPEGEGIGTGTPGKHGGNMDCAEIIEGTTLYLPVYCEGALLAMGDLHAVMGDGEVSVCGAEIAGRVTVAVHVIKNRSLPTPFLVNNTHAMTICSAITADQALDDAAVAMHRFLTKEAGFSAHDASMLLSLSGNLRICQIVDPKKTARMEMPIPVIKTNGYEFP